MEQREGRMDSYADGYIAGREDAYTAASIFLGQNGFHPQDYKWCLRFKNYVTKGVDTDAAD